jgi:hypothetical protein
MPETYSNGNYNTAKDTDTSPWCSFNLDWPYETVIIEAETITSREPNPFEWAIVRILQEFEDAAPTLAEAAEELGIKDPVFLTETLGRLFESGAVEKRDAEGSLDFSNCRLTSGGESFMSQHQSGSLAERHGMEFCFDVVTGEHVIRVPKGCRHEPNNPIISIDQLPERRTNIGLDKARKLAKAQNEPFLTDQSKLIDVNVDHEQGSISWRSFEVRLVIDSQGVISCLLQGGTVSQQQWLDKLDLRHELIERLLSSSIDQPDVHLPAPAKQYGQWQKYVDQLISPLHVTSEAIATVRSARRQIVAHMYWLTLTEVKNELLRATDRGVQCTLFGQSPDIGKTLDGLHDSIDVVQRLEPVKFHDEIAILTDESKGLCIDRIGLTTTANRKTEIIVASSLKTSRTIELRQGLQP